jgi:hypothetical protein
MKLLVAVCGGSGGSGCGYNGFGCDGSGIGPDVQDYQFIRLLLKR